MLNHKHNMQHIRFICALLSLFFIIGCNAQKQTEAYDWQAYKYAFMHNDGAIVDNANQHVRHTEAQGIGMLLAVVNQDKPSFLKIWKWTKENLQIRKNDNLFSWQWRKQKPHVPDLNNASDGDILIAWALLRAAHEWQDVLLQKEATKIMEDIKQQLIVKHAGYTLLLPGQFGFQKKHDVQVNLSYWVFPALYAFQDAEPQDPIWSELITSGLKLLEYAKFGAWKMPPDWLSVGTTQLHIAQGFPRHFGLDAVRIPLYLAWAGHGQHSAVQRVNNFWQTFSGKGAYPDWLLLDDTTVHLAESVEGVKAIAALTHAAIQTPYKSQPMFPNPTQKELQYYHASLILLSQLAWQEIPKE